MEFSTEEFQIRWDIVNYNFLSLKRGEMLRSPAFSVGISDSLFLELYPRGDILESDGESIIVSLNNNNLKTYSVTECDLSLIIEEDPVRFKQEKHFDRLKWTFKEEYPLVIPLLDVFGELTLTVKCLFRKNVYPIESNLVDMKALSQDMENLLISQQFSDLILITSKEEFPVHECIISSRIPKLMNDLTPVEGTESSNKKETFNFDSETLRFLLFYAYTGKLPTSMSNIPDGLYKAVEKYELNDLKLKLYFSPIELEARTCIAVDHIFFEWTLRDLDNIQSNKNLYSPAIPGGYIFNSDFKLICHFTKKTEEDPITISVQRIVSEKSSVISIRLRIRVFGNEYIQKTANHIFTDDEEWSFPLKIDFTSRKLCFRCEFYVSSGEKSSIVKAESCKTRYKNVSHDSEDLSSFCSDLGQLYNIFLPKMSDVSLHVGDVRFPVHKAVLASRSAVFSRMFETDMMEKKSGIVKITDIELDKVNMMLSYIYSGKLEISNANTAMELYSVADKYEITSLKKKCSLHLKDALADDNVCEILIFADMHSNEELKATVRHYLCLHAKRILRTSIFKSLIDARPDLASEVLHELLNAGVLSEFKEKCL